jgi:xanthine dehydrogenase accessory factor
MGIYATIEEYLKKKKIGIIATVIARAGSAPRDVGAKMFVGEDGELHGTIGGGRLEHGAYQEAMSMMGKGGPKVLHIRMNAKEVASNGMICGGDVDVLLEPVLEQYRALYGRLEYLEKRGERGVLVTKFDKNIFSKTLVEDDLTIHGDDISEIDRDAFLQHLCETKPCATDGQVIEPLQVSVALYIFGAGHVSQCIAKVAKMVDFSVTIIDDREEFANKERFPDADEVIVGDFQNVFDKLMFSGKEFVTIVTRGHQYDAGVLGETLKRQTRYVGMIGSKRKVAIVFDYLKKSGFDDEAIKKVYAPIGLAIHAETPQEIAVSIVAELIKVRGEEGLAWKT